MDRESIYDSLVGRGAHFCWFCNILLDHHTHPVLHECGSSLLPSFSFSSRAARRGIFHTSRCSAPNHTTASAICTTCLRCLLHKTRSTLPLTRNTRPSICPLRSR